MPIYTGVNNVARLVGGGSVSNPFTKLSNPSGTALLGQVDGCTFSPDGNYLVIAGRGHTIYKRSGDTFTKLVDHNSITGGNCSAFTPDGLYVIEAGVGNTNNANVFKRNGDKFSFEGITIPAPGGTYGIDITSDGQYLALAGDQSPYIMIYKINGSTFTRVSSTLVESGSARSCKFSPDGEHLVVAVDDYNTTLSIYRRSGDIFMKLSNPDVMPSGPTGECEYSKDGTYLGVNLAYADEIILYKRNGNTYTKANSITPGLSEPASVSFSPDRLYLASGALSFSKFHVFIKNGNTYSYGWDLPINGNNRCCCFSPGGGYLAIGTTATPYLSIYKDTSRTI